MALPSLVLLLTTLLTLGTGEEGESVPARTVEVAVDRLDVFSEADDSGFVTARLQRGDRLTVVKTLASGWISIDPPEDSFYWISDASVEVLRDGRIYVTAPTATLRLGRDGSPRPGPPKITLHEGAILIGAGRPLLSYAEGSKRRIWRAVKAGPHELRFIRSAGVIAPERSTPSPHAPPERRVSHEAIAPADVPPELVSPLRQIEGSHRAIVSRPIVEWELTTVRKDYQALLASHRDGPSQALIRERLDEITREAELAKAAKEFEAILKTSRRRDVAIGQIKEELRDIHDAEELAYDAEGLLQASSRKIDGDKLFCLLDADGHIVAYLKVPPGINTQNLLARQVGVRGKSRFNETIRYRLLDVRDMEPLR
jgi:hypothetical protein